MLTEIVQHLIPDQRAQRLEEYVRYLNARLNQIDPAHLKERLNDPEAVDVFEEGARQSARATSEKRREEIARLVAFGLTGEEKATIEAKRLLSILEQVDDAQIIILSRYLMKYQNDDEFLNKHNFILRPMPLHMQSTDDERNEHTVHTLGRDRLVQIGLLKPQFKKPKKGEMPEFDGETGMIKTSSYRLSSVGRLLLTRIGIAEPGEL